MAEKEKKTRKTAAAATKKAASTKTRRSTAKTAKPAAQAKTQKKAPPAKKAAADSTKEILAEVRSIKEMVGQIVPSAGDPHDVVDSSADALRRLLSDLIERRLESVIKGVAEVRGVVPSLKSPEAEPIVTRLDTLLGDLGAIRYEGERLDFMDPLIHNVAGERSDKDAPDGAILETVRPGYRTARGMIVAKADVVVNRRS
jgi:hypothetical protein